MASFLKNHPFAVEAFFNSSTVFTFAVPWQEIQHMIPECVELDIHNNEWAFIAAALVQTTGLRPKGFPRFLGNDFFLIGYRVFVRYKTREGKSLRGLYILKSETNKKKMEFLGNIFTHYNYTTTDIHQVVENNLIEIYSKKSGFHVSVDTTPGENITLPVDSPFSDWKQARRFAGPLPFTFTYSPDNKTVLIIEGVRQNWSPIPVKVLTCNFSFINQLQLSGVRLANAFMIRNVPYYWKKGKLEQWK